MKSGVSDIEFEWSILALCRRNSENSWIWIIM